MGESAVPVEVVQTESGWQLLRGGEPYFVKGAGGEDHLDLLAKIGGNSIRTWGQGQLDVRTWPDGRVASLLDLAHERGITVCAGFWVGHPRHGFDYDDAEAVDRQLQEKIEFVRKWKHHPAVLMWAVGNEVEMQADPERIFPEINRMARAVKAEDPTRPTIGIIAGVWPDKAEQFARLCPDIDILGINVYGGAVVIPEELERQGYDGPYMVTEYGVLGPWESAKTDWDSPIEQNSTQKASFFGRSYDEAIGSRPDHALGGYAFLWGQKQERTETWFNLFLKSGEKIASVDVLAERWTGGYPAGQSPRVGTIESSLARARVAAGSEHEAMIEAGDADGDPLEFRWVVKRETSDAKTGGDAEAEPETIDDAVIATSGSSATVRVPDESGPYRLFVFVYDGKGGAGTSNVPCYVE